MNIDILTEEQRELLLSLITQNQHFVVVGHKSPDGDAFGSCLAWAEYLRTAYGKDATVVMPDAAPDFLHWLPDSHTVVRHDKHPDKVEQLLASADVVCCLDLNQSSRTEAMAAALDASNAKRLLIDHHPNPEMQTELTVSMPEMSSTCELVFRIVWQLGHFGLMPKRWAEQVYCGMMTDTGGFTFSSTRPEIFFSISQLLTKAIDKDKIYRNVFNNYSPWAVRFRGYIMAQKLNYYADLNAAYFAISRMDMDEYHYNKGDAEGLVNVPLTIKGLKLSISLREDNKTDNLVWVSVRSVDNFPANQVAAQFFNGGGHLNAAGGKLFCSLEEACQTARAAIKAWAEHLR